MPGHIGIVACSAEGAALCFRTICQEGEQYFGPYGHPEISMHAHSFADYMRCIDAGDWQGVGDLMLLSADKLAGAGADFLICPDNTVHQSLPLIESKSPLPWLHIGHIVAAEAVRRGYRRLGVTGTRWLVQSDVYPSALATHGLTCVLPETAEREEINRIIMEELIRGAFRAAAIEYFRRVIAGLKERGCDAVVLGCTEIPLIINDRNSPLPALDSTRLLARAALQRAVRGATAAD